MVTVGGFKTTSLGGIIGILTGNSSTAARSIGIPSADFDVMKFWIKSQISILEKQLLDEETQIEIVEVCRAMNCATGNLKICRHRAKEYMNFEEVVRYVRDHNFKQYILVHDVAHERTERNNKSQIIINDNVFVVGAGIPAVLQTRDESSFRIDWPQYNKHPYRFDDRSVKGLLLEAISEGWKVDVNDIYKRSDFSDDDISFPAQIGISNGKYIIDDFVDIIKI